MRNGDIKTDAILRCTNANIAEKFIVVVLVVVVFVIVIANMRSISDKEMNYIASGHFVFVRARSSFWR